MDSKLKGGVRIQMFKPKHCAPHKNTTKGSCLDEKLIMKIAKILNKKKKITIDLSQSYEDIHNDILECMNQKYQCKSEACILSLKDILKLLGKDKTKLKQSFKPVMPKDWKGDDNAWLSTDDIEDALKQHQKQDENFYFYGAVPIDFSNCSVSNLCSINIKDHLKNKKDKIGIVFNTDPHTKDGQHWISMYIDLKGRNLHGHPGIYYFDSYGRKPPQQIQQLIDKIIKQSHKCNCKFNYFYNDKCYQSINAQCGMYSVHFIKQMMQDISFQNFLKSGLSDTKMIQQRDSYFIDPNELR